MASGRESLVATSSARPLCISRVLFAFTLLWFALAWVFRATRPREMRIGFARERRASSGTKCARSAVPARSMALYRLACRDPPPAPARAPVLLLHGVLCNAGAMRDLRAELVARKIGPVYTMSYGPPLESIELFVDQVAAKIDAILAATGASRVAIVGHSMGGIVAGRTCAGTAEQRSRR